jgi:hypothetical protein
MSAPAEPAPATATPAAPAAPQWDAIPHDVVCPLCDYNLRGLTDARCPECGHRFDWPDVIDPSRRLHPYLFEHHPERNLWSFFRTLTGTLHPTRFWPTLSPSQPSRPRRMVKYWVLCSLAPLLALLIDWGRATVTWWDERLNPVQFNFRTGVPMPAGPPAEVTWDNVLAAAGHAWQRDHPLSLAFGLFTFWLAWPWLTLLALQIFRISMRRAKVHTAHVVRCVVYSFDVGAWVALAVATWCAAAVFTESMRPGPYREPDRAFAFLGLMVPLIGVRLWLAYRRYMRFDHAFWTVAAAQLIVLLFVLNVVVGLSHLRW